MVVSDSFSSERGNDCASLIREAIAGANAPLPPTITLRTDAHHLFTDVWTSVGVVLGIFLVHLTGWLILDAIALIVAANIVRIGIRLLRETGSELTVTDR